MIQIPLDDRGMLKLPKPRQIGAPRCLAFKCTYNDRGYRTVCSDEAYQRNVEDGRVWCGNENNRCRELDGGEVTRENLPCYESGLFRFWRFGAGVRLGKDTFGKTEHVRQADRGSLAFLTTKKPFTEESERYIFGFLHIKDIRKERDPTWNNIVVTESEFLIGDPETSLELHPEAYIKYWDFHKNPKKATSKEWKTGLFRYLEDHEVLNILNSLRERYDAIDDINVRRTLGFHIEQFEKAV